MGTGDPIGPRAMSATHGTATPAETAIATVIADAAATGTPLLVRGNGTKLGMLRPVQAARSLSAGDLTGITLYEPKELVISARAGTPLAEIEAALAPPDRRAA
jgi:glycolate oxidase FAD binding subunit